MSLWKHIKRLDWTVILACLALSGIGLVSIYSSSFFRKDLTFFYRQSLFVGLGFVLMLVISFFDWRVLREEPYFLLLLYFIFIFLLGGLLIFGSSTRGIRGWYKLGPISFDPLPFMEIIVIIVLAKYFSKRHVDLYNLKHIFVSGLYIALPFVLVFFQPDLGSAILLLATWGGILLVSGIKTKHFLLLISVAIIVAVLVWVFALKPYQKERIIGFIFPESRGQDVGWSQRQSRIAIGSGGLWGKGFKQGTQVQLGFMTLPQTDFVFSAIVEEFGFMGGMITLSLISLLCSRSILLAFDSGTNFPRLFAIGLSVIIMFQSAVHVGVNLVLMPVVGIPLPFVSYGGSHLLAYFAGLGILQSLKTHPER